LLAATLAITAVVGGSTAVAKLTASQGAELKFVASQSDVPVPGEFRKFSADVDFDPARPTTGKVSIAIEVASVATGSADADAMLKGQDFFDAAHFPQATFTSTSIKAEGAGKFRADGQFTLKGRSLALAVPFTARAEAAGTWFEGAAPVSRLAYKVGEGEWNDTGTLADRVQIKFKLFVAR
jgi:polyisoprenoid-binding protein YceI